MSKSTKPDLTKEELLAAAVASTASESSKSASEAVEETAASAFDVSAKSALTESDLLAVFGMPPEKAIAYFERKGLKCSWDWQEVWRHANNQAFTVAKITRLDILSNIYNALLDNLKNGGTFRTFSEELTPLLISKGWWGQREQVNKSTGEIRTVTYGTPWRLATIYETNLQSAYMAGKWQSMMAAVKYTPWLEYVAVMDNRTRPTHAALDGRVFRYDDPFWSSWYPPNGFRCRCSVIAHTDLARTRGDFAPSSGAGRMEVVTRSVKKRDGSVAKVQVTGYKDPITGKVLTPDIGFDYNVATDGNRLQQIYADKLKDAPPPFRKKAQKDDSPEN